MALCCSNEACKAQSGPCKHEKIGLTILVLIAAFFLFRHFA
jgi:hypothetical protein